MTDSTLWLHQSPHAEFFDYLQMLHGPLSEREKAFLTLLNELNANHGLLRVAYGEPLTDIGRRISWMLRPAHAQRLEPERSKQAWLEDAFWLTDQQLTFTRQCLSQAEKDKKLLAQRASSLGLQFKQQYKLLNALAKQGSDTVDPLFRRHQQLCYVACDTLPGFVKTVYTKAFADRDEALHARLMDSLHQTSVCNTLLKHIVPEQCSFDDVMTLIDRTPYRIYLLNFLSQGHLAFDFSHAQHQQLLQTLLNTHISDTSLSQREVKTKITTYVHQYVDDAFLEQLLAAKATLAFKGRLPVYFYDTTDRIDPLVMARVLLSPLADDSLSGERDKLAHWVHTRVMDEQDDSYRQGLVALLTQQTDLTSESMRMLTGFLSYSNTDRTKWHQGTLLQWLTRTSERQLLTLPTRDGRTLGDVIPEWLKEINNTLSLPVGVLKRRYEEQLERLMRDQLTDSTAAPGAAGDPAGPLDIDPL